MKRIIWCCLVLAPFHLFAQNIDLQDISQVLHTKSIDSISGYLQKSGFTQGRQTAQVSKSQLRPVQYWSFRPGVNPDQMSSATLYKSTDSTGNGVRLETSNPWFYAHLMNQLPELGFDYQQTVVTDNNAILSFSNGREDLTISISNGIQLQGFQFTLKESSSATVSR